MKRIVLSLLAVLAFALATRAQNYNYVPRETWPYLLEDFTPGVVRTPAGGELAQGLYNICVTDGKLHYVGEGKKIMEADMRQVQLARIGAFVFVNRMGRMLKVVAEESPTQYLALSTAVDLDQLAKTDIGYGVTSATASSQRMNNLGLSGGTVSMELEAAIAESKDGAVLPLQEKYVFVLGPREVEARKSAVMDIPGLDKAGFKAFLKQGKIKWKDPESLTKVLHYLVEHTN